MNSGIRLIIFLIVVEYWASPLGIGIERLGVTIGEASTSASDMESDFSKTTAYKQAASARTTQAIPIASLYNFDLDPPAFDKKIKTCDYLTLLGRRRAVIETEDIWCPFVHYFFKSEDGRN